MIDGPNLTTLGRMSDECEAERVGARMRSFQCQMTSDLWG